VFSPLLLIRECYTEFYGVFLGSSLQLDFDSAHLAAQFLDRLKTNQNLTLKIFVCTFQLWNLLLLLSV